MRINLVIIISAYIVLVSNFSLSQGGMLVLNNGVYLVIDNGAKVFLENANANAISSIGGAPSKIISENENDKIIWKVGNNTGSYQIPWGKTGGISIPATVDITLAGSSDGWLELSTYGTTNLNTPYPSGVTNMTVVNPIAADGSLNVVDRFWLINSSSYTTKPGVTLTLTYDLTEIGGSNVIDEDQLKMQRWNNSWDNIAFGASNNAANTVSAGISPGDFFTTWILESSAIPLNISYSEIIPNNSNCFAEFEIKDYVPDGLDKLKVTKSKDGKTWDAIGYASQCNDERCVFVDEEPFSDLSYYKFENEDENGNLDLFEIIAFNNSCEKGISIYPNPTDGLINIYSSKNYDLELSDTRGRYIKSFETTQGTTTLDLYNLERGEYLLKFIEENEAILIKRIVKL